MAKQSIFLGTAPNDDTGSTPRIGGDIINDNFTELYTGAETVAAAAKATPVDADVLPVQDSAAGNVKKKVTWANIKATLRAYFDTIFLQNNIGISGGTTLIGGTAITDALKLQGTSGNGTLTSPAVQVNAGNDGATNAITILNNGKVGIGTTSPDYLLHVIGDIELEGVLLVDEYIYHNDDFHTNIRFVSDQIIFNAGGVTMLGLAEGTQDVFRINPSLVDIDFNVFSSLSSGALFVEGSSGNVGIGTIAPTAALHIKAGTATASTAPLKFTSGALNTTPEAGAVEFLTDAYYGTITTAAERKQFAFTSDIATNIYNEVPTGLINSSNDTYTTASTFVTNSTQTYLNGIRQKLNVHYIESGSTIVFQASYIPQTGDILFLDYQN